MSIQQDALEKDNRHPKPWLWGFSRETVGSHIDNFGDFWSYIVQRISKDFFGERDNKVVSDVY